jgi:hypothetical protein
VQPASGSITSVVIDFNAPLTASQAEKTRLAIKSAVYNASTRSVTLRLFSSLPRSGQPIALLIDGQVSASLTLDRS